ncbi:hypothetical protein GCM10025886_01280 [Tetragenococcus halophilus subsp. flandriensis]|nr:hypothetical protein GCM10025886_01280 [Tetragenococcus halophilus subsp. flandriensis]
MATETQVNHFLQQYYYFDKEKIKYRFNKKFADKIVTFKLSYKRYKIKSKLYDVNVDIMGFYN